jgi:archaellum component FlaC
MEVLQYLQPDNPIAQWIVMILQGLFAVWLALLGFWTLKLALSYRQMKRCADVDLLVTALQAVDVKKSGTTRGGAAEQIPTAVADAEFREFAFDEFCEAKSIKAKSPVSKHLKAIFDAGYSQGRLEIGELIKHTTSHLFQLNNLLRPLLATFIVIGLLGTLFGLADSLSQLSPLAPGSSPQTTDQLSKGLTLLLIQLKSAFAPSIWGILFTISGLLLFSLYVQFACAPVRNRLERLTLTVWVPHLFPNTSQRLQETLRLSEEQMHRSFVAAQKVAEFSRDIQDEAGSLKEGLKGANKTLGALGRSAKEINIFTERFVEGVTALTSFQHELRSLYEQMQGESREFHKILHDSVTRSETFQHNAQQVLDSQHKQLHEVLTTLRNYEDAYIDTRKDIDARLGEVLAAAKSAYDDLGNRNQQIVEQLGDPLRKELSENLAHVQNTLTVQLKNIQDRFGAFDAPITKAAEQISGSLESVVKRTETLTRELQREIIKQEEKNQAQLNHLGGVNEQVAALLQELIKTREFQGGQAQAMSRDIGTLSQNIATLSNGLATIGQAFTITGQSLQQLERLSKQNKDVVDAVAKLSRSVSGFDEKLSVLSTRPTAQGQTGRAVPQQGTTRALGAPGAQLSRAVVPGDRARATSSQSSSDERRTGPADQSAPINEQATYRSSESRQYATASIRTNAGSEPLEEPSRLRRFAKRVTGVLTPWRKKDQGNESADAIPLEEPDASSSDGAQSEPQEAEENSNKED